MRNAVSVLLAVALLALSVPGCGPKVRKVPELGRKKLERRCGLTEAPLTREQALCVAHQAKVGLVEGEFSLEEGATSEREPVWILRETCPPDGATEQCVEIWIRRSDGIIVNSRYLHAFEDYDRLPR